MAITMRKSTTSTSEVKAEYQTTTTTKNDPDDCEVHIDADASTVIMMDSFRSNKTFESFIASSDVSSSSSEEGSIDVPAASPATSPIEKEDEGTATAECNASSISSTEEHDSDDARRRYSCDNTTMKTSKVQFSTVEIREHPITMGDNPSVSSGVPITIEWNHQNEFVCDIDVYEEHRPERRDRHELVIPQSYRSTMCIQSAGYSRSEILKQQKTIDITRKQRRRSVDSYKFDSLNELFERSWRATMNATVRKNAKRAEREYIQRAIISSSSQDMNWSSSSCAF